MIPGAAFRFADSVSGPDLDLGGRAPAGTVAARWPAASAEGLPGTPPSGNEVATMGSLPRLFGAGFAAGALVFVSGLLMAALFGYRELAAAFEDVGLEVPVGTGPFITHTVVRFGLGMATVALYAVTVRSLSPDRAVLVTAGLAWVLGAFFPYLVVTEWGLVPWHVTWKVWGWSAMEFLGAAAVGRVVYRA